MASLLRTLLHTATGRRPRIVCSSRVWNQGVNELRHRAGGRRESGAFLLGTADGGVRRIRQFLFYDDVDPDCFTHGIVEFDGQKFGAVWQKCREANLMVVADVHVHPGGSGQSKSDRNNPMIPDVGHLALILPDYALRTPKPGAIGIYEYFGSRKWQDHSHQGDRIFRIGWWPR